MRSLISKPAPNRKPKRQKRVIRRSSGLVGSPLPDFTNHKVLCRIIWEEQRKEGEEYDPDEQSSMAYDGGGLCGLADTTYVVDHLRRAVRLRSESQ
jgi:hypothetical protein